MALMFPSGKMISRLGLHLLMMTPLTSSWTGIVRLKLANAGLEFKGEIGQNSLSFIEKWTNMQDNLIVLSRLIFFLHVQ